MVYGALQVPDEYRVCDVMVCDVRSAFYIPVVLKEMDGYTFQCFSVDYRNNTVNLGTKTALTVLSGVNAGYYYNTIFMYVQCSY